MEPGRLRCPVTECPPQTGERKLGEIGSISSDGVTVRGADHDAYVTYEREKSVPAVKRSARLAAKNLKGNECYGDTQCHPVSGLVSLRRLPVRARHKPLPRGFPVTGRVLRGTAGGVQRFVRVLSFAAIK